MPVMGPDGTMMTMMQATTLKSQTKQSSNLLFNIVM
jgi:hypothetical protein